MKRTLVLIALALVLAACSKAATSGTTTSTAGNTGSVTTGAPSATSPPTTAATAAADVGITSCSIDPNDSTFANVAGTIVNHDTVKDDYSISITLLEGSLRVGEASDTESNISAGQTSTWSSSGSITGGNGGTLTCQIASVSRTASTP